MGAPSAAVLRPAAVEGPLIAWHGQVNTSAVVIGGVIRHSGQEIGDMLRQTILSGTFLGRVRA